MSTSRAQIMSDFFRDWRRRTLQTTLVLIGLGIGGYGVWKFALWRHSVNYPFGWSHCCDKGLSLSLMNYAEGHGGAYPAGEATPEASLSLLFKVGLADANLLRGKSVPETTVKEILNRGELLGPDSCGWNYIEGLRKDDDGGIAIFWDKEGLDHNGGRLRGGGHIVFFVSGMNQHIPAEEWPKFLAEQQVLRSLRSEPESKPMAE